MFLLPFPAATHPCHGHAGSSWQRHPDSHRPYSLHHQHKHHTDRGAAQPLQPTSITSHHSHEADAETLPGIQPRTHSLHHLPLSEGTPHELGGAIMRRAGLLTLVMTLIDGWLFSQILCI